MARFHQLEVTGLRKTIRDAVEVTLAPVNGADFSFIQGQYLTFRRDFDGTELRRSYSICSGLDDGLLQVGVKRVDGGAFSTWVNTELKIGDRIEAMAPMGRFHAQISPEAARHHLAFAGGSGITPVLSIIRTVLAREPHSRLTLVYANKAINTIMFREELEALKNRYMGRLTVVHILEADAQDIDLFTGLVTEEKCAELFARWIDIGSVDLAFICGPEPMMHGIVVALKAHGLTDEQIKFELFKSAQPGRLDLPPPSKATAQEAVAKARITLDGATRTVSMAKGQTVLEAALAHDLDAPFACRAGVCSTCRCKVTQGEAELRANHALEDYEVAQGFILSCQAIPVTDEISVDYDQ